MEERWVAKCEIEGCEKEFRSVGELQDHCLNEHGIEMCGCGATGSHDTTMCNPEAKR